MQLKVSGVDVLKIISGFDSNNGSLVDTHLSNNLVENVPLEPFPVIKLITMF